MAAAARGLWVTWTLPLGESRDTLVYSTWYIFKIKNDSCEIEDFVETHIRKLRGILLYFDRANHGFSGEKSMTAVEVRRGYTSKYLSAA